MATRRLIVRLLTLVGGLFFIVEFLIPGYRPNGENFLSPLRVGATTLLMVVSAMAFLLGPISLVRSHLMRLVRRQPGVFYSLTFLVFLVFGIVATAVENVANLKFLYNVAFYGFGLALGATSMAILAFYLMSAAYRSFRLNNLDSGVMMGAAVIVLLGLVPLGDYLTYALPEWLHLGSWASWILEVPNVAIQRAVLIGAVAGAFAAGLRQWLGLGRVVG
ncbi:MAG: hypothetical protein JW889_12730 [Verrucomicrobia bacterium]|nr:hypothetical protein [Verrucomicrobiota bacterium]